MQNISVERLNALIILSSLVNSSLDIGEIRKRAVDSAVKLIGAEAGSILLVDNQTGDLYFDTAIGEKEAELKTLRLKRGQGIAGWSDRNCHRECTTL